MKIPPLAEAIKRLCARDPRYAPEAYQFLLDGLQETVRQIHEKEKAPAMSPGRNWLRVSGAMPWHSSVPWP